MGHLRENGFEVKTVNVSDADLGAVKERAGVPAFLRSCHTATVGNYIVEGHVPADVIRRLLADGPAIKGLAVPGMPVGSPGMEDPRGRRQPYQVVAFDEAGNTQVYARR